MTSKKYCTCNRGVRNGLRERLPDEHAPVCDLYPRPSTATPTSNQRVATAHELRYVLSKARKDIDAGDPQHPHPIAASLLVAVCRELLEHRALLAQILQMARSGIAVDVKLAHITDMVEDALKWNQVSENQLTSENEAIQQAALAHARKAWPDDEVQLVTRSLFMAGVRFALARTG